MSLSNIFGGMVTGLAEGYVAEKEKKHKESLAVESQKIKTYTDLLNSGSLTEDQHRVVSGELLNILRAGTKDKTGILDKIQGQMSGAPPQIAGVQQTASPSIQPPPSAVSQTAPPPSLESLGVSTANMPVRDVRAMRNALMQRAVLQTLSEQEKQQRAMQIQSVVDKLDRKEYTPEQALQQFAMLQIPQDIALKLAGVSGAALTIGEADRPDSTSSTGWAKYKVALNEQGKEVYATKIGETSGPLKPPTTAGTGRTITTGGRIKQFNTTTGKYDIDAGPAQAKEPATPGTAGERYISRAAQRMGKTVDQLTQEEEMALVGEFEAARKYGATPELPDVVAEIPEEDTLWNSLGWMTTGLPFSGVAAAVSTVTGWDIGNVTENRQRFETTKNALLRALAKNPRYPEGEQRRIEKQINISPNGWTARGTLRTRMRVVDNYLADMEKRLGGSKTPSDVQSHSEIQQFRAWLGVPGSEGKAVGGPAIGTIEDGYRFKGGDPANQKNWEKVQ